MKNILAYIEESALKYPNKIAVECMDNRYSFSELLTLSKKIGASLGKLGVKNSPFVVMAERDITTIAFFIGVLYSGNYYVPIDPEMPDSKKQAIIDNAQPQVILGVEKNKSLLERLNYNGVYFSMSDIGEDHCDIPDVGDSDPLYMIYTSGSTGIPKGVLKSHKAMISYIEAYCDTFSLTDEEVIGNQTPFFFDASAKDIYMMFKLGCTLEILPSTLFSLPPELIDYLNQKKITYASWVPTVLSIVAQLNPFSVIKPTTLKKIFFVGEVMPMKHLNKWRSALPDIKYVNLYGQSEIAGVCCYYEVNGEFANDDILPMGLPLKNCKIYLLDKGEVINEPNHIGEAYIVSDALATEYYRDNKKTSDSFIIHDFGDGPVRCFKTGDLAQYDEKGNLIFASRTDFQIKHMGHRIELGEIEAVAGAMSEIARACCLYNPKKKHIVLFCQLNSGAEISGQEIRSLLRSKLSSYMLPNKVVVLESLPLNPNGKIDRQALKSLL